MFCEYYYWRFVTKAKAEPRIEFEPMTRLKSSLTTNDVLKQLSYIKNYIYIISFWYFHLF